MFKSGTSIKVAGVFIALCIFLPILICGSKIINLMETLLLLLESSGIEVDNLTASSYTLPILFVIFLYFIFTIVILGLIWILGNLYDKVGYVPKNTDTKPISALIESNQAVNKSKSTNSNISDYEKYIKLKQQMSEKDEK